MFKGTHLDHVHIWSAINYAVEALGGAVNIIYYKVSIVTTENKTECIFSCTQGKHISTEQVLQRNLKLWKFL
jgi:hypothetical protein